MRIPFMKPWRRPGESQANYILRCIEAERNQRVRRHSKFWLGFLAHFGIGFVVGLLIFFIAYYPRS